MYYEHCITYYILIFTRTVQCSKIKNVKMASTNFWPYILMIWASFFKSQHCYILKSFYAMRAGSHYKYYIAYYEYIIVKRFLKGHDEVYKETDENRKMFDLDSALESFILCPIQYSCRLPRYTFHFIIMNRAVKLFWFIDQEHL